MLHISRSVLTEPKEKNNFLIWKMSPLVIYTRSNLLPNISE